jgi:SAM-dependent methyltransferase
MGQPTDADFTCFVNEGILLATAGGHMYPVSRGLPILLPYRTEIHETFAKRSARELEKFRGYRFASETPAPGEREVCRSFSQEWLAYQYDGVLWEVSYEDNRRRLVAEIGLEADSWKVLTFLEVGCGIGVTTFQAQQLSGGDAVGMDLSLAVLRATYQFRTNPFLHFVQASAFAPPFEPSSFDIVYSRGVLHHTWSTRRAFLSVAPLCRAGGRIYLWVYGPGSISASLARLGAYAAEALLRPVLSRAPASLATVALTPIAAGYIAFNALRRWHQRDVQPYTFDRALHAARDRFTPRYAYRQSADEVTAWFREAGCGDVELVDWRQVPAADQDDYRRNTGVRARR